MITKNHIVEWIKRTAAVIGIQKEYLTDLDRAIGDADHGNNMDRGFKKVLSQLDGVREKNIGAILKTVGMALISSVGGAAGPLYGTFYLQAAQAVDSKTELTPDDLYQCLRAGTDGVIKRGRANPGDKTMIDTLQPAVDSLQAALREEKDLMQALREAIAHAERGMKDTIPLVAKKGRASYLGDRSAGHQDPGATSAYLILNALLETMGES
jgi:phosphoenolpyruvate---glycerone phosphotransferase subunit DhaL